MRVKVFVGNIGLSGPHFVNVPWDTAQDIAKKLMERGFTEFTSSLKRPGYCKISAINSTNHQTEESERKMSKRNEKATGWHRWLNS